MSSAFPHGKPLFLGQNEHSDASSLLQVLRCAHEAMMKMNILANDGKGVHVEALTDRRYANERSHPSSVPHMSNVREWVAEHGNQALDLK